MPSTDAGIRISVVIPAFNEAAYLGAALDSLAEQDFAGGIEVIVVDNGSTDQTADLAFARGARVVNESTPSVCAARQRGTELARGEIVVSTDADTTHPRTWLSAIDAQFRRDLGVVAVAGPCRYLNPPRWTAVFSRLGFGLMAAIYRCTGSVRYITATNVAFRRHAFPGYNTVLTQGGDETDLLRRLRRRGRVVWDHSNGVETSSRRMELGLAHTLFISYGYYYGLAVVVNRLASRTVIGRAPAIRRDS
jgi:glycosyltransferase involved in cell wall biosynthesis